MALTHLEAGALKTLQPFLTARLEDVDRMNRQADNNEARTAYLRGQAAVYEDLLSLHEREVAMELALQANQQGVEDDDRRRQPAWTRVQRILRGRRAGE